ncbi:hypothetical protein [Nocardioides nanhaiensis]|uniref:DUF3995 domain-containing protein n=1 Tax=Nocardioides nanhaiensis TaxID=1476871 RepID=A0ABP8VXP1_9ACTN
MRRPVVLLLAGVLTVLTLLLLAGHGPWAGETLWAINGTTHGLNDGDVPVLVAWAVGMAACAYLWREER